MRHMGTALCISFTALSSFILFLLPAAPARADFDAGRQAYFRGDYDEAFAHFLPSALQGNAKSQIGLGLLLARGQGTDQDFARAYSWFDMAVVQSEGEHFIVRILARTNRDYLLQYMGEEQVATARLWSRMVLATPEALKEPVLRMAAGRKKADAMDKLAARFRIQLAALRSGNRAQLLSIWSRLSKRHKTLGRLNPALVRLDLGDSGVYEGLRAGPFDTSRSAFNVCAGLLADKQDCFVVAR